MQRMQISIQIKKLIALEEEGIGIIIFVGF